MQSKLLRVAVALFCLLSLGAPARAAAKHHKKVKTTSVREAVERNLPRTTLEEDGSLSPVVHAASAIVYDPDTETVLYELNGGAQRPIASITKVMTARVFLEDDPDLSETVQVLPVDVHLANHTYLRANDRITVDDLLHLLLIGSDNAAARVLARVSVYGSAGFIDRMNEKAQELGLLNTVYADPSGLLSENVSTVYDIAQLVVSTGNDDYISGVMHLAHYTAHAGRRAIPVNTTDHLLGHPELAASVLTAKTGFIHQSGYCLATMLRVSGIQRVAIVVFGATTNAARFIEVQNLYRWLTARANAVLHVSQEGVDFIKSKEGFHSKPYFDHKGWAIGYGTHFWNGRSVTRRTAAIQPEDADVALPSQLVPFENIVKRTVVYPLQQNEFDALVSVAYNLGRVNETIQRRLAAGQHVTVKDFLSTATVKNRPYAPLVVRRSAEFGWFMDVSNK
jgi:D-alanyl-D-alanine endopeptidase (penicillin-binding protein 7)